MGWLQSLIAFCLALVALLVGAVGYLLGRNRTRLSSALPANLPGWSRFKVPSMPWSDSAPASEPDVLGWLRSDYPAAVQVLTHFEKDGEFSLLTEADPNARNAFADLRSYARSKSRPKPDGSSSLQLSAAAAEPSDQQVKAALVTVFRTIYSNQELVNSLGEDGEQALDAFLMSLTD